MAEHLHLELLGGLRIRRGEQIVTGFVSGKALALMCYLGVTGRPQFRGALAALLWSELPEAAARMNLRHVLANLRQITGEHLLITRESVALDASSVVVDVDVFESALRGAAPGDVERLRAAVSLYAGDFLNGFSVRDAPVWDEWVISQRERLRQLALFALHGLVTHHSERAEIGAALDYATRLLQLDPWREEAHRQVMLLLAESGQPGAALAQYETCRRILQDELGVEPDEETIVLHERIKVGEIVPRLPLRPSSNLTVPPTTLLGREGDIDAIAGLLQQPNCRLLTLLGPGGVGKTRLALEVATQLVPDFEGVWLVELAPVRRPDMLSTAIAQVLELRESGRQSLLERIIVQLRDRHTLLLLDNFEHLLHAAPAVGELLAGCRDLKILVTSRAALRVRGEHEFHVSPLAVPDLAAPLAGKDVSPASIVGYAAIALFVRHAASVWPGFALTHENAAAVAEICCRLDGLPLALELAAARIKLLSPQGIKARLGNRLALLTGGAIDLPTRQQTLRKTIQWSYDLLAPADQALFRRLAVCVGSYGLEDAQAVCNLDVRGAEWIIDAFETLLDRSLLRMAGSRDGEQRFDMLETIHEYAAEQLEASGEAEAVRRRHAAYFLAMAEVAEPHLQGAEQRSWLDRLELDHDNLRAALQWTLGSGEADMALRLSAALGEFWWPRGFISEGRRWLEGALELPGDSSSAARAKALYRAGELAYAYGDYVQSVELLEESLGRYRALNDPAGIARVLRGLATSVVVLGEEERAKHMCDEALRIFTQIDDRWGIAWMLYHLALLEPELTRKVALLEQSLDLARAGGYKRTTFAALNELGTLALQSRDYQRAELLYGECLELGQELGDLWLRALPLAGLGLVAENSGNFRRAKALFESSLLAHQQVQNQSGIAQLLSHLGDIARWQNDLQGAASRYKRSLDLFGEMNDTRGVARSYLIQGHLALAGGEYANAVTLFTQGLDLLPLLRPEVRPADYIMALGGVAMAAERAGQGETAACLFGGLEGLGLDNATFASLLAAPDSIALHGSFNAARKTLPQRFSSAWAGGRAMSLSRAIAYAQAAATTLSE